MTEPTNHYMRLSMAQRARLYAHHGEILQFARYAAAADMTRKAEARIAEIKSLPPMGYIALDMSESEVLGVIRRVGE